MEHLQRKLLHECVENPNELPPNGWSAYVEPVNWGRCASCWPARHPTRSVRDHPEEPQTMRLIHRLSVRAKLYAGFAIVFAALPGADHGRAPDRRHRAPRAPIHPGLL